MMKCLKVLGLMVVLGVFLLSSNLQAQEQNVLAKIGTRKITVADLNKIIGYYDQEQQKVIETNPQMKESILWQLVQGLVISKIARDKGFDKRTDIKNQQEILINNFLTSQYILKEVIEKVTISEAKVKAFYKDNADQFKTPDMIRVRHILIRVESGANEEEKKKSKVKAEEVLAKLTKGEDFAKLAAEVSDDPGTKSKGGDLDFFPRGTMIPAFEDAAFALKPGELSKAVETEFGYHLIKLEEKKDAFLEPYDKIKEKVKDQALQELRKAAVNEFIEKSLKNAKVEINPGRLQNQ